tara:strand:- start:115 stop:522 length:408 start_codon:yes stop_codon:yes gene_type:complete
MVYEVPDIYTIITIVTFLFVIIVVAYFVKSKSKSLKKIIKNKNKINIVEYLPVRGGFSSYVFSIDNEEFFFIGHKTGNGSLIQIQKSDNTKSHHISNIEDKKVSKEDSKVQEVSNTKKPLQHVNISDLLALHKKG